MSSPSRQRIFRQSSDSLSASSIASLPNSDFASEDSDRQLPFRMPPTAKQDCSDAMVNVLGQLDQIVEHLRDKGENDAANGICKMCHEMLNIFNTTTAIWDIETFLMEPRAPRQSHSTPVKTNDQRDTKSASMNSWATIAATPTPDGNKIVKYGPEDSIKIQSTNETLLANCVENIEENSRVIWICPWPKDKPISRVTEKIQQGPLFSVVPDEGGDAVCIIFQNTYDATQLIKQNTEHLNRHGQSLFGPDHAVLEGDPYPKDRNIALMEPPTNERRRLTFARAALFTGSLTEARFKKDISDIVGEHNIELVWLFNSGNATVVFTGTLIARVVRDEFRRLAKKNGPYKDVGVSFSHDPCERPLNLITQIQGSSHTNASSSSNRHSPNNGGGNGRRSGYGASGNQGSRNAAGGSEGGWTTVIKRR